MKELPWPHIVASGDELGKMPNVDVSGTFSKSCLRTSMPKPKQESRLVKITNRKLTQLSPKPRKEVVLLS